MYVSKRYCVSFNIYQVSLSHKERLIVKLLDKTGPLMDRSSETFRHILYLSPIHSTEKRSKVVNEILEIYRHGL